MEGDEGLMLERTQHDCQHVEYSANDDCLNNAIVTYFYPVQPLGYLCSLG